MGNRGNRFSLEYVVSPLESILAVDLASRFVPVNSLGSIYYYELFLAFENLFPQIMWKPPSVYSMLAPLMIYVPGLILFSLFKN